MKRSLKSSFIFSTSQQQSLFTSQERRILQDSLQIQEQTDLLSQIWQHAKKNKFTNLSTQLTDMSFDATDCSSSFLKTLSCIQGDRSRSFLSFTNESQVSFRQSLDEIKSRCSRKTYYLVRQRICGGSMEARCQKKLERQMRHNQELMNKIQRLTKEKIELENKLNNDRKLQGNLSEKTLKVSKQLCVQTEASRVRFQKSLLLKQKSGLDLKKLLEKQLQLINKAKKQNEELKQEISKISDRLLKNENIKDSPKKKQLRNMLETNKKSNQKYQKQREDMVYELYNQLDNIVTTLKKQCIL